MAKTVNAAVSMMGSNCTFMELKLPLLVEQSIMA